MMLWAVLAMMTSTTGRVATPLDDANAFLRRRVQEMSHVPAPAGLEQLQAAQKRRKKQLFRSLGLDPIPPRTPLHARITGVLQCDGYRIEKLAFESRPRFYVTAHVYVPEPPGAPKAARWPVIMNVNGHWAHKKDEDRVQLRCAFEALRGFLAIAVDSPGFSFEGNHLIERRAEGDHNDWQLVEGGTNATGYYVWDTMRALDYISGRKDADMTRVGITGASGGGLATLYAFAADDRYKAAVPVVYMSSMELAPDNGCLCNHVPGTCQIGDRSDVIAIQAPKPVLLMGAQNDGEFPPDAMRLTHTKMASSWALYGRSDDVFVKIFPGGHDYNQGMRESMIGFFEKYLLGKGDGSPVPEPALKTFDPEDHRVLTLDPPASDERTMRDLALESLTKARQNVSAAEAIAVNGGMPARGAAVSIVEPNTISFEGLNFEAEPGLRTQATVIGEAGESRVSIWLDDDGADAAKRTAPDLAAKERQAFLDTVGVGKLAGVELRYLWYAGRSAPFEGGIQIVRLLDALNLPASTHVEIHARGPITTQAAMWAALMEPRIGKVVATDCLASWEDVFKPGVSEYAVQPRANLCGSLAHLRSLIKNSTWQVRSE